MSLLPISIPCVYSLCLSPFPISTPCLCPYIYYVYSLYLFPVSTPYVLVYSLSLLPVSVPISTPMSAPYIYFLCLFPIFTPYFYSHLYSPMSTPISTPYIYSPSLLYLGWQTKEGVPIPFPGVAGSRSALGSWSSAQHPSGYQWPARVNPWGWSSSCSLQVCLDCNSGFTLQLGGNRGACGLGWS